MEKMEGRNSPILSELNDTSGGVEAGLSGIVPRMYY